MGRFVTNGYLKCFGLLIDSIVCDRISGFAESGHVNGGRFW